jgi:hypothetical protein
VTTTAWITMAVILTVVWGGFIALAVTALRKESGKRDTPE